MASCAGRIFSTTSFSVFEVIVSRIVLEGAQVLRQSCSGMAPRAIVKGAPAVSNNFVSVHRVGALGALFFCADVAVDMLE